jgi:hypothetical protein
MLDWKKHGGGPMPEDADRKIVRVRLRSGHEQPPLPASSIRWQHVGLDHDTVEYAVDHTEANAAPHRPYDPNLLPVDSQ